MTRAAEIIDALDARAGVRLPRERSTGLPYGWALWLKARAATLPATAPGPGLAETVALLAARPPRPRQRGEELGHPQALLALLRQGWLPPPPEERPLRALSSVGSLALHLLFLVLLAWVTYLQSLPPPPVPGAGGGGGRIGVGFISREDGGGGEGPPDAGAAGQSAQPAAEVPHPAPRRSVAADQASASAEDTQPALTPAQVASVAVEVAVPEHAGPQLREREVAVRPEPVPQVPLPSVPRVAHEVVVPEAGFQVREREVAVVQAPAIVAPVPRAVDIPLPVAPEAELRTREIIVVEAPVLPAAPTVAMPQVQPRRGGEPELRQREVDEPLPAIERATPAIAMPQVQPRPAAAPALRQREIAMPEPGPASAAAMPATRDAPAAPAPSTTTAAGPAATSGQATAPGDASPGDHPSAADPTREDGHASSSAPGGPGRGDSLPAGRAPGAAADPWARVLADDSWGPAGDAGPPAPGLFDGQGRARLPGAGEGAGEGPGPGPGSGAGEGLVERGAPGGGNDAWSREQIEQSGTWLKRPPYDYEPTSFDRYWVPNQSLLADWVRKGIKSVAIPIPGSNGKKLNCVVSLLQLGGGCGISDDNLNEQPAQARPPPDIPFKPALQEDNGSVPVQ